LLERKKKFPKLLMQFIVMEENASELSEFIDFWKVKFQRFGLDSEVCVNNSMAVVDGVNLRLRTEVESEEKQLKSNQFFCETLKKHKIEAPKFSDYRKFWDSKIHERPCCYHLFRNVMIRANGEVTVCANDLPMGLSLGNINTEPISKILSAKKLFQWRLAEIFGRFECLPSLCQKCVPDRHLHPNDLNRFFLVTRIPSPVSIYRYRNDTVQKKEHVWKIRIQPEAWYQGHFDDWDIAFLGSNEGVEDGYSMVLGRYSGFVNYRFDFLEPERSISMLTIRARIASHSKVFSNEDKYSSEIELQLNGIGLGKKRVYWTWPNCQIQEWAVWDKQVLEKISLRKEGNLLSFVVSGDIPYKNGISICSKPLSDAYRGKDIPIEIDIDTSSPQVKVLLINPLVSSYSDSKGAITLGLGHLASYIRFEYECRIIDMDFEGLNNQDVIEIIRKEGYSVVGFTGMTYQADQALELARAIKTEFPAIATLFGGPFFSNMPEETLEQECADFVVIGEGEQTLLEILDHIREGSIDFSDVLGLAWKSHGNITLNPQRHPMDPGEIKHPARDLMPSHGLMPDPVFGGERAAISMFSRGCVGSCIFCSTPKMWGHNVRMRPIESVVAEIRQVKRDHGVKNLIIDDDIFTLDKGFVSEFCSRVMKDFPDLKWRINTRIELLDEQTLLLLKKAGCVKITFGIESGDPDIQKRIGKFANSEKIKDVFSLCKKNGVQAAMLLIIGHPGETPESVQRSVELVKLVDPSGGWDFQILQPHPGTAIRERFNKPEFGKILTNDWNHYFSDNITYLPSGFSKEEFYMLCRKVTGRPIKYLGEVLGLELGTPNLNGIHIIPWNYERAEFDDWRPFFWEGEGKATAGFSHFLGRNVGYVTYVFQNRIPDPDSISVSARICSHSKRFEKIPENASDITLQINGVDVGTKLLYHNWPECPIEEWTITDKELLKAVNLREGKNAITFRVKENAKHKNGITIYYKGLTKPFEEKEMPIIVKIT
jgi:radical SAM superfamily enzyme YgiQ (UPF0313 family)